MVLLVLFAACDVTPVAAEPTDRDLDAAVVKLDTSRGKIHLADTTWDARPENRPAKRALCESSTIADMSSTYQKSRMQECAT